MPTSNPPFSKEKQTWTLSATVLLTLVVFVVVGAAILWTGRRDYADMHIMLDTSMFTLPAVTALLFWDMGNRIESRFAKCLAISFGATSLLAFLHALVGVELPVTFISMSEAQAIYRPTTWPPPTHLLPIGIGLAIWLSNRNTKQLWPHPLTLLLVIPLLYLTFRSFPPYTPPIFLGITRPALIVAPVLWAIVGVAAWRRVLRDRFMSSITLLSAVLVVANAIMLYSRSPHDSVAIVAHVGLVCGYLVLLISVMQLASTDMRERVRAERELAQLNTELEQRVLDRTAQLAKSQEQLLSFVEQAPISIAMLDREMRYLVTSRRWVIEFGKENEDLVGRSYYEIHPDLSDPWKEIHKRALAGEFLQKDEDLWIEDRSRRWLSWAVYPWRDTADEIAGVIISFEDIDERKQGQERLQTQLGRLELLNRITRAIGERQDLPSIFQVVVQTLEDRMPIDFGCVCLYDPAQESLLVKSAGVKGQLLAPELGMQPESRIPIDQNGLSRCVRGQLVYEADVSKVKFAFPQRLASQGLRSLVATPLLLESKVFGVLLVARREPESFTSTDCEFLRQLSEHIALASHQSQIHSALEQAYEDLRQTQLAVLQEERLRALGQMASGIAHDINNAISPITLYTEALLEGEEKLSDRARNYLETISQAIGDVAATVARMREFYRQREPQLTLTPVDMNKLAQQVMDLTRPRWLDISQREGISIEVGTDLAVDLPAIMGIESEIREALINLVFNAVDSMREGGKLTFKTHLSRLTWPDNGTERVTIEITDTGMGMDEDTRRHCLEPFFTTKGERGTGLGLAMVFGMIERHSAEIEIESELDKGTTVRLSFNVPETTDGQSVLTAVVQGPLAKFRILIIDDDPVVIKSLRDILEGEGQIVTTAQGGQSGIDTFKAAFESDDPFEVVVTDLGMPYVDGRKVAKTVKEVSPLTPVILLTGWGQRLVAEGDIPPHVDRVVNKPPRLRELREALKSLSQRNSAEE
jgi:PAS domain S-box-containing protein